MTKFWKIINVKCKEDVNNFYYLVEIKHIIKWIRVSFFLNEYDSLFSEKLYYLL